MNEVQPMRQISIARFWMGPIILLAIAVLAFWPSYFAPGLGVSNVYTHLHAATASIWMIMLALQPWLVKNYRFDQHRTIGKASYVVAPIVVVSMLLLANYRIRTVADDAYPLQTFILYLQISLAFVFTLSFVLGMIYRREAEVHGRFMLCTGFTLIDPIFARLFFWIDPATVQHHQWFTFGLTDIVLIALIIYDRKNINGRWVFRLMLPIFVATQLFALLQGTNLAAWQSFAQWFRGIPLT